MYGEVIVGFDGTDEFHDALAMATMLARAGGSVPACDRGLYGSVKRLSADAARRVWA